MVRWLWHPLSRLQSGAVQRTNDLKLRTKLLLAFAFVLLLSVIALSTYHVTNLTVTKTYNSLIEVQQAIKDHAAAAKLSLLKTLVNEKNFLFHKNKKEGLNIQENLSRFKQDIVAIKTIRAKAGAPDKALREMDRILARVDKYEGILLKITDELNTNGFDTSKVAGDMKRLDSTAKNIDKRISKVQEAANWNMERKFSEAAKTLHLKTRWAVIVTIISFVLSFLVAVILSWRINKILFRVISLAGSMSKGDFTRSLTLKRKDEFGMLAHALNQTIFDLGQMIQKMTQGVGTLTDSSSALSSISDRMSHNTDQTANKADNVAGLAEEMSTRMNSVAAASEEASTNLNQMSAATEQMASTVNEIAQNGEKAQGVVTSMVEKMERTSTQLDTLSSAVETIGSVTETITEISEQTNLLALNATIEAARAGEAGKGFAVVAAEIKTLSAQTASATEAIKEKINGIRNSTRMTVSEMSEIGDAVEQVNLIVSGIAASVSEQAQSTTEVASNISQASSGIREMNENIAQSSSAAAGIAREMVEVNTSAGKISTIGSQVNTSADQLFNLANDLKKLAAAFKVPDDPMA